MAEIKYCKRGHPRTPENVASNGGCKTCALENARKWRRKKRATDPEWVAREFERINKWRRERYATDPEYRERVLEACWRNYPRDRMRQLEKQREQVLAELAQLEKENPWLTK